MLLSNDEAIDLAVRLSTASYALKEALKITKDRSPTLEFGIQLIINQLDSVFDMLVLCSKATHKKIE